MNRYYLAQVVTEKEYKHLNIGAKFGTGIVVDGLSYEKDFLIITVHEGEDDDINYHKPLGIDVL